MVQLYRVSVPQFVIASWKTYLARQFHAPKCTSCSKQNRGFVYHTCTLRGSCFDLCCLCTSSGLDLSTTGALMNEPGVGCMSSNRGGLTTPLNDSVVSDAGDVPIIALFRCVTCSFWGGITCQTKQEVIMSRSRPSCGIADFIHTHQWMVQILFSITNVQNP